MHSTANLRTRTRLETCNQNPMSVGKQQHQTRDKKQSSGSIEPWSKQRRDSALKHRGALSGVACSNK